jgi:hypothetical protein
MNLAELYRGIHSGTFSAYIYDIETLKQKFKWADISNGIMFEFDHDRQFNILCNMIKYCGTIHHGLITEVSRNGKIYTWVGGFIWPIEFLQIKGVK